LLNAERKKFNVNFIVKIRVFCIIEVEVVTIMINLFDNEQIMRTYAKDIARETAKETTKRNAITMLKKGRISLEEISAFFPELTSDDVEEIKKEVMQLA